MINNEKIDFREFTDKNMTNKKRIIPQLKKKLIKLGYVLDILRNGKDIDVCRTVPQHGYGPDKLINAKEPYGPTTVAEQGYRLDILVKIKI